MFTGRQDKTKIHTTLGTGHEYQPRLHGYQIKIP